MMNALFSQTGRIPVLPLDEGVAQAVQAMRNPAGDGFFGVLTALGNAAMIWLVMALGFGVWSWASRDEESKRTYGRAALGLVLAMATSQVMVEYVIKPLTLRPRPITLHPDWNYLDLSGLTTSFPSGHSSWAFSAVPILWAADRRFGIAGLVFALVMGASRVYVSAHWFTDVLCGAGLGLGIGFGWVWVLGRLGWPGVQAD